MSSTETEIRIKVNGTELFVRDTGEEDLPVVLALHSLFLDGRMFEGFKDAAAGRYRVVRPDFRGQGRSAAAEGDIIHLDTVTADVIALSEALNLARVHLLVQSMGGDVGFRLAMARPALITSMVVLGSSACSEPADQLALFREWVDNVGRRGFVGDVLQETMEIMFGVTTRNDPAKQDTVKLWESRISEVPPTLRPAMAGGQAASCPVAGRDGRAPAERDPVAPREDRSQPHPRSAGRGPAPRSRLPRSGGQAGPVVLTTVATRAIPDVEVRLRESRAGAAWHRFEAGSSEGVPNQADLTGGFAGMPAGARGGRSRALPRQ
ncbi:alpha/beta fold hydrolase [Nonomuraea angiospora]|uniref:alpha/beta fold hydrolase n=1 Tax=Nonomuraea angiospora TaxID=46172 RepID=UPI0033C6AA63